MTKKAQLKNNIAVTTGDPVSIGPEVVLQALIAFKGNFCFTPVVIGDYEFLRSHYKYYFDKIQFSVSEKSSVNLKENIPNFINIQNTNSGMEIGRGSVSTGRASLDYIDFSIDLWKKNLVSAVATAPVNKGFICESGTAFQGHTEYFAAKTGNQEPFMMMYSHKYRVILVTTHHAVFELKSLVTYENILKTIHAANDAFCLIDSKRPKLAICGLDPHCGDNGAIGTFDREVTLKAVNTAKNEGIDIHGPFSADTLFIPEKWSSYSCVIVHYHDQGLIPFKMLAFENGVNVTLGLPIVRTSADHGTAYDIAGKGIADFHSMKEAIEMAHSLSLNRL